MKRCLAFALALTVMFLAGCGADPEALQEDPTTITEEQPTEVLQQEQEQPPEEVLNVSFALTDTQLLLQNHGEQKAICTEQVAALDIVWTSSDETVAAVQNGTVTAVNRGKATVTAQYEGYTLSCDVICDLPVLPVKNENAGPGDPIYLPPEVEIVDDAFFDDALFISDSQGWALYKCAEYDGYLGESMHMTRNSYSVDSAANDRMLLSWAGQDYVIERAIERTGAKRVFIMLGVNDVGHYKQDELYKIMDNWQIIVDRIRAVTPDVQICLESIAPVFTEGQTKDVTNEKVTAYNELLKAFAEENGCVFVDVATYLLDATGGMAEVYCSDKFVHLNAAGVDTWIKVLKACTDYE